jgi:hypothetical protein
MKNSGNRKDNRNHIIRLLFSILLIFLGLSLSLLSSLYEWVKLISDVGLAIMIAGIASTFHEAVIRRLEGEETAAAVAEKVQESLREAPLSASGIRLVSPIRKGYAGYYQWAINNQAQDLFFAGRSVLHRIDADFRNPSRSLGTAEERIAKRLCEGCSVRILFLNPRTDLIERLSKEETQTHKQLLGDITTSLGICQRLYDNIKQLNLPHSTTLSINVFDEVPYFAYHKVEEQVIVGFYFSSIVGHASAAFEVVDPQTKEFFGRHFDSIMTRANSTYIVRTNPHNGRPEINSVLMANLKEFLIEQLESELFDKHFKGNVAAS